MSTSIIPIMIEPTLPDIMNSKSIMTQTVNTMQLTAVMLKYPFAHFLTCEQKSRCYPLCVQRAPVQFSAATATPSHRRPPCLGSGAVQSLLRCLSQAELHTDHSLQSPQPPSTKGSNTNTNVFMCITHY